MSRTFGNFYTLLYFYSTLCAFLTKIPDRFICPEDFKLRE